MHPHTIPTVPTAWSEPVRPVDWPALHVPNGGCRNSAGKGSSMLVRYRLMFFTATGALAFVYFGTEEYSLSARSSKEPEEISVRDLIRRGPEGNPNIVLKDFSIFEDYVYKKKMISGRWTKVWVPIVP